MRAAPTVTIGIPALGLRQHLSQAITSLVEQTFCDWQALIADDGNAVEAGELVASFADPRLTYVGHERSLGFAANCNFILESCGTEFCGILHDDDWYHPDYLAKLVGGMREHAQVRWAFCNARDVREPSGETRLWTSTTRTQVFPRGGHLFRRLARANCICCPTVLLHREVYREHRFSPWYHMVPDWELWLKLSLGHDALFIGEPLLTHRDWAETTTHKLQQTLGDLRERAEIYRWVMTLPEAADLRPALKGRLRSLAFGVCRRILNFPSDADPRPHLKMLAEERGFLASAARLLLRRPTLRAGVAAVLPAIRKIRGNKRLASVVGEL